MKIPNNEQIVVNYVYEGVKDYVVTYHPLRGKYILYRIIKNDYQKMKVADTPIEFDNIVEKDRDEI
jgi:hypothetical protein